MSEPSVHERVYDLVDLVFPGMKGAVRRGMALGAPWAQVCTPFVRFEGEVAVTHVGVLEIPMVLQGSEVKVGGIHAVCTHPEFRGRGYFRDVLAEALEFCAAAFSTVILFTGRTSLYEPFGFRAVPEHLFRAQQRQPAPDTARNAGLRLLDTSNPGDVRRLHELLETRAAVSNVMGVVREAAVFCVNEAGRRLYYAEDLNAVLSFETEGSRLKLFDVVSPEIPPLEALLERFEQRFDEVEIHFNAERRDPRALSTPYVLSRSPQALGGTFPSHLMVKGPFAAENRPFMVPPSVRC